MVERVKENNNYCGTIYGIRVEIDQHYITMFGESRFQISFHRAP